MSYIGMIKSVTKEYGVKWIVNRSLYSIKLKALRAAPQIEKTFEKKLEYPKQLDIFDIDVEELRDFLQTLSEEDKEIIIITADNACKGIIRGFSSIDLNYGNPIDWQLSPLTGKRCDETKKWFEIPDFDKERGDIKVIWEASRFSHFVTLVRAYLLTNDRKYYNAFSKQLDEWIKLNTYGCGANFKCGQECSLRMVNALLAFTVFEKTGTASKVDTTNITKLIYRSYYKVLSNFFYAYKCIKNNHTISELMGMIVGAWCCDDQKQLEKAYRWLDEVIDEQFTDDGGYRQLSFNYQRLALQDLECILSVEKKTGMQLSNKSREKIKKAAELMYQCQDESGDMPNYGSNDGALVFLVTSCEYRNFRPVINTTYALITGKQMYREGIHQEELIWFSGGKNLREYDFKQLDRISSQFTEAGLFTLRDEKSWMMVVSNDYYSRPAHMDQNHIDLWVDGVNVLCDAGSYSYASELGRELVRNEGHNTAVVDGNTQMKTYGPFMIYDWTKRKLGTINDNSFEGTMISKNGYMHSRKIRKSVSTYEIIDSVDADFSIMFHTPCEVVIENGDAKLSQNGKQLCTIISNGEMSIEKSKRSLYYLKEENMTCLRVKEKANQSIKTIIKIS